jgi:hypothetical protein
MLDHLSEVVHHAYYIGELAAGRRACERLLSMDIPDQLEQLTRSNRLWYQPTLSDLVDCHFRRIDVEPAWPDWSTFNPTVIAYGGEVIGIVRSSNYHIVSGEYRIPETDGRAIRTENLLVRFAEDFTVASCRRIDGPEYLRTDFPVRGLEDCRLRLTATGLGVSATIRDASPFDGRCRIASADLDTSSGTLGNVRVFEGMPSVQHEKNWMPLVGGSMSGGWIYAPWHSGYCVTVDAKPDGGEFAMHRRASSPIIARRFRGGSQAITWNGGYLACVHEVADLNGARCYEHRFVWFDGSMALRGMSPPFAIREPRAIEFAAGLAHYGDQLILSFGVRDEEAWLAIMPDSEVRELLAEVESTP